ncbi:MAG: Uncharacterised protein [Flavobacteriaceae bacterium]|nr:MAG: Uncharacterised protein [Flavobacteriaceae bacterium]
MYIPPPTRANNAIDSAPKENPASVSKTIVINSLGVFATPPNSPAIHSPPMNILKNIMKNNVSPKTANPATPSPITVPPPNDTLSAFGKLVFAACVVLTLVLVAIFIPIFPAYAEKIAPKINAIAIDQCVVGTTKDTPANATATMITKNVNNLYSAFKKANAPS